MFGSDQNPQMENAKPLSKEFAQIVIDLLGIKSISCLRNISVSLCYIRD